MKFFFKNCHLKINEFHATHWIHANASTDLSLSLPKRDASIQQAKTGLYLILLIPEMANSDLRETKVWKCLNKNSCQYWLLLLTIRSQFTKQLLLPATLSAIENIMILQILFLSKNEIALSYAFKSHHFIVTSLEMSISSWWNILFITRAHACASAIGAAAPVNFG